MSLMGFTRLYLISVHKELHIVSQLLNLKHPIVIENKIL